MAGIAVGLAKGHEVTKRELKQRPARRKGALSTRIKKVRAVIRQCTGFSPYERRVMELLKVGKDKRALKMCKRKLGTHLRGKKKRDEMASALRQMQSAQKGDDKPAETKAE